jgi:hypothetical protein
MGMAAELMEKILDMVDLGEGNLGNKVVMRK